MPQKENHEWVESIIIYGKTQLAILVDPEAYNLRKLQEQEVSA